MRILEVGAVAAFLLGCAGIVRALLRTPSGAQDRRAWEPYHRFDGTARRVYVRRGEDLEPVGAVSPDQPDYEDAFLALMDRARERASTLNSER